MARNPHKIETIQTEQVLLKKLQAASLALARALSPEEVMRIAGESIRDILLCDIVWILLADESGKHLETHGFSGPKNLLARDKRITLNEGDSILSAAFNGRDPLFLDNLSARNDPVLDNLVARFGASSLNLLPLSLPDGNIGLLVFGRTKRKTLSVEEKRIVLVFAHQIAISLERAQLHAREQQSVAEVARLNELKSRLLHGLSHGLKTPLTSLKTSAAFLKDYDNLDARTRRRLIENVSRATERLINVADDIYPVADALTADMQIEREDVDCRQIVSEATDAVRVATDRKGQTIHSKIDDSPGSIKADGKRLKQVLLNLLTNAGNFSPEGSNIEVTVRNGKSEVTFGVSDQGIGISHKDQQSIFNGFYQAENETVRRSGGKGIGLLLAKTIVELHGGRIWVKSQPGKGSAFYFSIPVGG